MTLTRNDSTLLADTCYFVVIYHHNLSHYLRVTVWSAFLLFFVVVVVCLLICLVCLCVLLFVCLICLSVCII